MKVAVEHFEWLQISPWVRGKKEWANIVVAENPVPRVDSEVRHNHVSTRRLSQVLHCIYDMHWPVYLTGTEYIALDSTISGVVRASPGFWQRHSVTLWAMRRNLALSKCSQLGYPETHLACSDRDERPRRGGGRFCRQCLTSCWRPLSWPGFCGHWLAQPLGWPESRASKSCGSCRQAGARRPRPRRRWLVVGGRRWAVIGSRRADRADPLADGGLPWLPADRSPGKAARGLPTAPGPDQQWNDWERRHHVPEPARRRHKHLPGAQVQIWRSRQTVSTLS